MEGCLIARHFPGFGDPWRLTMAQWNGILDRLNDIIDQENPGDPEDPKTHERRLNLMKRQRRRREAWERHGNGRRP